MTAFGIRAWGMIAAPTSSARRRCGGPRNLGGSGVGVGTGGNGSSFAIVFTCLWRIIYKTAALGRSPTEGLFASHKTPRDFAARMQLCSFRVFATHRGQLLFLKWTATHPLHRKSFQGVGNRAAGIGVVWVEMDGQDESALFVLLNPKTANTRLLKNPGGMFTFDRFDVMLRSHPTTVAHFQAKVTLSAWRTSSTWLAMVWLLDPANSRPIALLVDRSIIKEPESPAALNEVP